MNPTPTDIPTPREIDYKLELDHGKYTYIRYKVGGQEALRYGNAWRDLTGDNLVYFLAARVEELERENVTLREENDKQGRSLMDAAKEISLLKTWKNEDPRMLREQIRVADEAFNTLTKQRDELKAEVERLKQQQDPFAYDTELRRAFERAELAEKTICELREALKGFADYLRAVRYSYDRGVPLPSIDALTDRITKAELALSLTPSEISEKWVKREVLENLVPHRARQ